MSSRTYKDIIQNLTISPVFTTLLDGKVVAWMYKYKTNHEFSVCRIAMEHGSCRECTVRANNLHRLSGPNGALFFGGEEFPTADEKINQLRDIAEKTCTGTEYELVLVTSNTFAPIQFTGKGNNSGPFNHWTVVPDVVTDPSMVQRMIALWSKVKSSVLDRLSNFLSPGARDSMQIIISIVKSDTLKRPEYWNFTCQWVLDFQTKFTKDFAYMSQEEKEELCVYAMATGYAENDVHINFQTSENLIDFMTLTSMEGVAALMDARSNPRTNQVSQLAQAKAAKGVTCKFGIGLVWDGVKCKDDLDLHVQTLYGKVYFGQKQLSYLGKVIAKLDFDAGISGNESNPAENISISEELVGKKLEIYIDCYTRRTPGDIQCTIVITQQGEPDIEIPVVWPKDRPKGNYLHVRSHTFTPVTETEYKISEAQARAASAQEAEFNELFGRPSSTVATIDDLISANIEILILPESTGGGSYKSSDGCDSALDEFDQMVISAGKSGKSRKSGNTGKKFLSQHMEERSPSTLDDLWNHIEDGRVQDLHIHIPDHVPGYVVKVEVASDRALKGETRSILSPCHFDEKFKHPIKPVKGSSNARFDRSWFDSTITGMVQVIALAKINDFFFLVLEKAILSTDSVGFPLTAGFYPQDLSTYGHKHRSKWCFMGISKPKMSNTDSVPVIGTFLTGETATVFVNGQKLNLKV